MSQILAGLKGLIKGLTFSLSCIGKRKSELIKYLIFVLGLQVIILFNTYVTSEIISCVNTKLVSLGKKRIILLAISYALIMLFEIVIFLVRTYFEKNERVELKKTALKNVLKNYLSYRKYDSAKLTQIIYGDINVVTDYIFNMISLCISILSMIFFGIIIYCFNKVLAISLIVIIFLWNILLLSFDKKLQKKNRDIASRTDNHFKITRDLLLNRKYISDYSNADFHVKRYVDDLNELKDKNISRDILVYKMNLLNSIVDRAWTVAFLYVSFVMISSKFWSPALIVFLFMYSKQFMQEGKGFLTQIISLQSLQVSLKRYKEFMEGYQDTLQEEMVSSEIKGLSFNNIKYRYSESEDWIFDGFTLNIGKGISLLVGRNGTGKTTLLNLIANRLPLTDGSIELVTENDCAVLNLSSHISYCLQDDVLFDMSIIENLWPYKNVEMNIEEVMSLTKTFGIYDDIMNTSKGFESRVGELREWSGGQKKKLMLVRTFLRKNDVVLLDEPFEGIDKESKRKIVDYIRKFASKRIVFVSTHEPELFQSDCKVVSL